MANVKRIYVEKKEPYAVRAKELRQELREYLDIRELGILREKRRTGSFLWSTFRGSLTRGQILRSSA